MRVSYNEVQVICRKAFEGLGFAPGDCDDAADMIARLQQQGLDGIGALKKPWRSCMMRSTGPSKPTMKTPRN
ncbi:DUF3726 domain-containing protein [Pseudomonas sp. TH10]|uniref:DUF3726 domain-containing protein n=1 Tax=Pseudomonas sp. TH10 TaxID=2796376 RepID=UPI001F5B5FE1|nr:DUF3726 domain-containing protein [Pseudomonas sp. TH10]